VSESAEIADSKSAEGKFVGFGGEGNCGSCKYKMLNGVQRRDRTADAGLFRAGLVPVTRNIARIFDLQHRVLVEAIQKRLK
jgi:hypothetical protein